MSIGNILLIAIAEARTAVAPLADKSVHDRFRAACKITHHHWLLTTDDQYFRAAVGAVLVETKDPAELAAIEAELETLKILSAMFAGVPVDLSSHVLESGHIEKQFGLMRIYQAEFLGK